MAHEIGHYLLESRDHSDRGLMRGTCGPEDAKYALDYSLDAAQITRIRLLWAQRQKPGRLASR